MTQLEETSMELLDKFNLNWEVKQEPLFLSDGSKTPFWGTVNQNTRLVYQTSSKRYEPLQNHEIFELIGGIVQETEAKVEKVETFNKGGLMYISVTGREVAFEGRNVGDRVGEKLTLINSHDGSRSFGIGFAHLILSCLNGMERLDKVAFTAIRHTTNLRDKIGTVIEIMQNSTEKSNSMIESYKLLTEKPVEEEQVKHVLELVTGIDPEVELKDLSPRMKNILQSLWRSITSEMQSKGQTAWGLLNGVTHYTTRLGEKNNKKRKAKIFGSLAEKDLSVWNYLTEN